MLFNSFSFALFFPVVFLLYWFVFNNNLKHKNLFLLLASFLFFACFDWRFLFLLVFSILLDYFISHKIYQSKKNKKSWLWLSIIVNLCFLGFFKYFNFFIDNFSELLSLFGFKSHSWTLNILLPVGISFYTFHGLSYVIDVYNQKIQPEKSLVDYSLFVSFFPLLVAGPIERATHLLPQIKQHRIFNYGYSVDGLRQILWGLVKKVVIADGCATFASIAFDNPASHSGSDLVIGAFLFSFQIYGDFSGYSDIALGTARLLGFDLLQNFSYPYFSRDIAEFWRRWHISLSSWFRDYIYIPLGGSRSSKWLSIRNIFVIFLLSGFWHGANWTFIFWGLFHAVLFIPLFVVNRNRKNLEIVSDVSLQSILSMLLTFCMVTLAWIFFRATNLTESFVYINTIFSSSLFTFPTIFPKTVLGHVLLFVIVEWFGRNDFFAIQKLGLTWHKSYRLAFYFILASLVLYYSGKDFQFIYFQF